MFYGRPDDSPLARALEAAGDRGVDHVLVDQAHLARDELLVAVGPRGIEARMVVGGAEIDLAGVDGIYARPLALPVSADPVDGLRADTFQSGFLEWLDAAPGVVVSRPRAMDSNSSKPFQAQLIARFGFEVPDTLVSSDPEEVLAFRRHHGRVVYKSTGGVRSVVRELDDGAAARLALLRTLPAMFQAHVAGTDVRVHVVGARVFATEVRSDATDYRYAGDRDADVVLTTCGLPDAVEVGCRRLAAGLGLPLCGIDLRRRPDGGWVCFEVNPMPAYSYYEAATGQGIAQAIVSLLTGTSEERRRASGGEPDRARRHHPVP